MTDVPLKSLSIAIPTYKREEVLVGTIQMLLMQRDYAEEILIIDQTPNHKPEVAIQLGNWDKERFIRWIRMERPSQMAAMNKALCEAKSDIVLFLDDDIYPGSTLVVKHVEAYRDPSVWAVAGRVIQPWDQDVIVKGNLGRKRGCSNPFNSTEKRFVEEVIGCNFSVLRSKAVQSGGLDENFVKVGYKNETEFVERIVEKGGKVLFEPEALVNHLQDPIGGTRSYGVFGASFLPHHSVGAYYYFIRSKKIKFKLLECIKRLVATIFTKNHLRKPWRIPMSLIAEFLGFWWAVCLCFKGPKFISSEVSRCL